MPINILMPALSPTMEKGNLAKWLKKEGDKVKSGDVIAEIETDKATMEVEAVDEGTIAKILIPEGTQDVAVNDVIAVLAGDGEDVKAAGAASAPPKAAPAAQAPAAATPAVPPRLRPRRQRPRRPPRGSGASAGDFSSADQRSRADLFIAARPSSRQRGRHRARAHQRVGPAWPCHRPRCRGSQVRQGAEGACRSAGRCAGARAVDVGQADSRAVRAGQLRDRAARRHAPHDCPAAHGLGADRPAFLSDDGLRYRQTARRARGDQRRGTEGQGEEAALQAFGQRLRHQGDGDRACSGSPTAM